MGWFIVGDSKHATFAGDTSMFGFGPLLSEYGHRDAKAELREFAQTLDKDPRVLHRSGELRDRFDEWRRMRRMDEKFRLEPGDHALDRNEPTPSPEKNTVYVEELIYQRADEFVIEDTGKTVAQHNPGYPADDAVIAGRYPNMSGDTLYHFPQSRLQEVI